MSKIFWFDTETTGVDANANAIVQLAYIIEIDGEVVTKENLRIRPFDGAIVEAKALEVNKLDPQEIYLAPPESQVLDKLREILSRYVDRYDKYDKFIQAGYNVGFDDKFLRQAFIRTGDNYYGSWFHWPKLDTSCEVAKWLANRSNNMNARPKNFKLGTLCEMFDVPIQAHDAMSDIVATRELYYKLVNIGAPIPSAPGKV